MLLLSVLNEHWLVVISQADGYPRNDLFTILQTIVHNNSDNSRLGSIGLSFLVVIGQGKQ